MDDRNEEGEGAARKQHEDGEFEEVKDFHGEMPDGDKRHDQNVEDAGHGGGRGRGSLLAKFDKREMMWLVRTAQILTARDAIADRERVQG